MANRRLRVDSGYKQDYERSLRLFAEQLTELRQGVHLTQSELAAQVGLSANMIGDIERGQKTVLDFVTVARLADGLGLQGIYRDEFFARARLIGNESPASDHQRRQAEMITDFYAHVPYPAFVQDALCDLHSANTYMFALFGMELEQLRVPAFSGIGVNILRVLFDPIFDAKHNWIGVETYHAYVSLWVFIFRIHSQKHITTDRYQEVLAYLMQWPSFHQVWQEINEPDYRPHFPIPIEFRPRTNTRLRFIMVDAAVSHLPIMQLQMTFYVPADESTWLALDNIKARVPHSMVKIDWEKRNFEITAVETLK